jgi:hypothetical protein
MRVSATSRDARENLAKRLGLDVQRFAASQPAGPQHVATQFCTSLNLCLSRLDATFDFECYDNHTPQLGPRWVLQDCKVTHPSGANLEKTNEILST